jgi:hypothetical protein
MRALAVVVKGINSKRPGRFSKVPMRGELPQRPELAVPVLIILR